MLKGRSTQPHAKPHGLRDLHVEAGMTAAPRVRSETSKITTTETCANTKSMCCNV